MPKFLKDTTIGLLDSGVETYVLALYGMAVPSFRVLRKAETKYAPIGGLFGAASELLVKACLVQAKGTSAMYQDGDVTSGVYRFGSEVIEDLRRYIRDEAPSISYIWCDIDNHQEQKEQLLYCLGKFKLYQRLRANGLHAGIGCARDIAIATATDVWNFTQLLLQSKRLRPYLKNIPAPEETIRDREAIIEDLTRRLKVAKDDVTKADLLHAMYIVLPYIPEIKPDWIEAFDRIAVAPPTESDLTYLAKTLSDAHSIYLLKNRGGKDGVPVRVEPKNPDALPIAIQNIKRTLNTTPDKFNNDVLTANTRLEETRLDLPLDEFLVDLYALGLEEAGVLTDESKKLTAQQTWPFVASAYSTQGIPRPCWFIIRQCDEIDQLIAFLKKAEVCGNGYYKRRLPELLKALGAYKNGEGLVLSNQKTDVFKDIPCYKAKIDALTDEQKMPFTPAFLRKYPLSTQADGLICEYISGTKNAGDTLAALLESDTIDDNDKKAAAVLLPLCYNAENKNGIVSVLRTPHMKNYVSNARKMLFIADFIENGPQFK